MKSPIVLYIIAFACGILLQQWLPALPLWLPLGVALLFCGAYGATSKVVGNRTLEILRVGVLMLAVVAIGLGYSTLRQPEMTANHYIHKVDAEQWEPYWMEMEIVELPHLGERSVKCVAELCGVADSAGWHATCGHTQLMLERTPRAEALQPGDRLLVCATLHFPSGVDNPHQFDYRRYLHHRGILTQCYLGDSYQVVSHNAQGLRHWSSQQRQKLLQLVRQSRLTPSQQGVAEALVLGWKEDVDPETLQRFRDAGITHLLCVSGLHVGIVAALLGYCFLFLGYSRRGKALRGMLQLLGVWLFVLLTGMAPATMRAAIMFSFIIVGQMCFARPPTANAVGASALLLLLIRPAMLFDVGFQLSYAAVAGIVAMHRPLKALIQFPNKSDRERLPWPRRTLLWLAESVWGLACLTTVAQLSTLPFTLFYFHQFPLYFLIANLVVVPFAGLLLGSILVMMLVSGWGCAFRVVGGLVSLELQGVDAVLQWVGSLPHAMLDNRYFDLPMTLMAIGGILCLAYFLRQRDRRGLLGAAAFVLLLTSHDVASQICCSRQRELVVYSVGRHQAVELFVGRQSLLLADSAVVAQPGLIDYQRSGNLVAHRIRKSQCYPLATKASLRLGDACYSDHALLLGDCRMVLVDRDRARQLTRLLRSGDSGALPRMGERVDYLLLTGYPYIDVAQLQHFYQFDTLVLTSATGWRQREQWAQQCDTLQLPYRVGSLSVSLQ